MEFLSTRSCGAADSLDAILRGLAPDGGLYVPARVPAAFAAAGCETLEKAERSALGAVFDDVAEAVREDAIRNLLAKFPSEPVPLVHAGGLDVLELFHGPTLAFKDVGARFMARLLQYFLKREVSGSKFQVSGSEVNVLVATSGDTGSAVANGFLGVEGIHVYVLYPKGKVSPIQECQFTTLGKNITAIEVDGVFDDCQALVKSAFMDADLNAHMKLTSANSINVARFLPQAFYYFNAYARMKALGKADNMVMCVPSGNFGNICAALFGHAMGLPIKRFIAANNANDIFYNYLQTGKYNPQPSKQTLANAMDVGDPSNFARIYDLYKGSHEAITSLISGATYKDEQIRATMQQCYEETGYILDPHGACGYQALKDLLKDGETGVFCETAHPAKFKEKVDEILSADIEIPQRLQEFMKGTKQSIPMSKEFKDFKEFLLKV